jgi:uncharacterized RDD family membrane protein YckC
MKTFSARETTWLQELDGIELADFWPRAIAFTIDGIFSFMALSLVAIVFTLGYIGVRKLEGKPLTLGDANTTINSLIGDKAKVTVTRDDAGIPILAPPPDDANTIHRGPVTMRFQNPAAENPHSLAGEAFHLIDDILVPILYFGIFLWKGNGRTPGKRIMKIRVVSLMHTHITFWHAVERALGYGAAALEAGFGFFQFFLHPYRRCAQDRLAETIVVTERSYQQKFPDTTADAFEHLV